MSETPAKPVAIATKDRLVGRLRGAFILICKLSASDAWPWPIAKASCSGLTNAERRTKCCNKRSPQEEDAPLIKISRPPN